MTALDTVLRMSEADRKKRLGDLKRAELERRIAAFRAANPAGEGG